MKAQKALQSGWSWYPWKAEWVLESCQVFAYKWLGLLCLPLYFGNSCLFPMEMILQPEVKKQDSIISCILLTPGTWLSGDMLYCNWLPCDASVYKVVLYSFGVMRLLEGEERLCCIEHHFRPPDNSISIFNHPFSVLSSWSSSNLISLSSNYAITTSAMLTPTQHYYYTILS